MLRGRHGIVWMINGWVAVSGLIVIAVGAWLTQFQDVGLYQNLEEI